MRPVEHLMLRVAATCEELALPYFVTGSVASMAWGESRHTLDVDIVIELASWKVRDFCAAFPPPEYYVSEEAAMAAARAATQFNIVWTSLGVKADIMVFRGAPFDESRLARARRVQLPDVGTIMVSAPEDVILKKLEFFREGGSDKHLRDITSMIRISGDQFDWPYIEAWALRLGVVKEWRMIQERLRSAGP